MHSYEFDFTIQKSPIYPDTLEVFIISQRDFYVFYDNNIGYILNAIEFLINVRDN